MKKPRRVMAWIIAANAVGLAALFVAWRYGSPREQALATALAVASPIPIVP